MSTLESASEQNQQLQVDPFVVSEYGMYLENAFANLGMSIREATRVVEHQRNFGAAEFVMKAANLEAYRSRITDEPDGISTEIFNHAINTNPGQVLADASHWNSIRKSLQK